MHSTVAFKVKLRRYIQDLFNLIHTISRELITVIKAGGSLTQCVKPLRHLATSSTQSSKWSVLIG